MLPPRERRGAVGPASGSLGPSRHLSKLPGPDVVVTNTVSAGFEPSLPPMNSIWLPDWMTEPSVRGFGSEISGGATSHGIAAPTGGGHGSDSFEGGQRLIGLQARMPRSIVRLTMK